MANNDLTRKADMEYKINCCKKWKISITKPLIPLKIVLFCYYGAGSFVTAFLTVYFKQRGITLTELSTAYIIAPAIQILGTMLSGIITDKIGRSKPVLVANLMLNVVLLVCILLVPRPSYINCEIEPVKFDCDSIPRYLNASNIICNATLVEKTSCDSHCIKNFTKMCNAQNILAQDTSVTSPSFENIKNEDGNVQNLCVFGNFTMCKCDFSNITSCNVECAKNVLTNCYDESERSLLSTITMILYILWMTMFSSSYRIFDVTAMFLIKEHDADYGKQRLFSMIGSVIISTMAGYLVKITTPEGYEKNYTTAFYFFISLVIFCILVVYKLDVRVQPPGKQMAKKAMILLKNPDAVVFAFVVLTLGSAWNFTTKFLFWYLEELQAPSILIGLIPAVGALYGLPFLFTSEWWMKKFGTTTFFVIGLLGYTVYGLGYSFLQDPWISLLLESLNIAFYHLLWVAVILKSHEIAPEGLTATVISFAGAMHFQIGKTSGSLIARLVMNRFGGAIAFRAMAGMCFTCALLYLVYLYCRKRYIKQHRISDLRSNDGICLKS